MQATWLEKLRGMLRLTRAERTLTLALFLVFQAMLPSYASAISGWSGDDRLVLCTSHGLIAIDQSGRSETILEGETLCLVAQSNAADMAQAPIIPQFQLPQMDVSPLVLRQLFDGRRGLHLSPHAQRAPPLVS